MGEWPFEEQVWCGIRRDQFGMRRATPLYSAVLEAVPHPFVGNRRQLLEMLKLLSDQMAKAFQENDEACPPWRRYCALVSKWLPKEVGPAPARVPHPVLLPEITKYICKIAV